MDGTLKQDSHQEEKQLSRRERERKRRRRAMLEAAQAVFAEKGYARATIDEIAERAEFGKGTLYNYFEGGKEAILFAIFDEIYNDLCNLIRASFDTRSEADPSHCVFHEMIRRTFRFFFEREELFFILIKEECHCLFGENAEKAAYVHRQEERLVEALVPSIEAAQEAGTFKPLPPHAVAHMLLGNINGILMHVIMARHHPDGCEPAIQTPDQAADFLTTMLFDGLLAREA